MCVCHWHVMEKGSEALQTLQASPPDKADHGLAPFLPLENLVSSNAVDGLLCRNNVFLPFRRLPMHGLGIGGYLHSEATSITSAESDLSDIEQGLKLLGLWYLLAEAPMEDMAYKYLVERLVASGWRIVESPARQSPFILFHKDQHKDIYSLLYTTNKKERRNVRASRRKMEAAHSTRIEFWEKPIDADIAADLADVEKRSSKAGKGIFSPDNFQQTLALLHNIPVRIALLYLDEVLVAWDLDIEMNDCVYSYNRAYDTSFSAYAPGKILHYENLDKAYARVSRAELLGDADALKMRLATGVTKRIRCAAFPPGGMGLAAWQCYLIREKIKKLGNNNKFDECSTKAG